MYYRTTYKYIDKIYIKKVNLFGMKNISFFQHKIFLLLIFILLLIYFYSWFSIS